MEPIISIRIIGGCRFVRYEPLMFSEPDMRVRATSFYELMNRRKSVREFSNRPLPRDIFEQVEKTASTVPSGANK
jgi:hypothetical protein